MKAVTGFIVLIGFLAVAHAGPTRKPPPGCSSESFEKCGTDLIIFAGGPVIAKTKEELGTSCPKEKASEKCARDYATKCLPRFPRGMVMLLLDGIRNEVNGKCDVNSASSKDYLKHAACMNSNGETLHQCMKELTHVLDYSLDAPSKKRLALSCCSFATYKVCMTEAVRKPCGNGTMSYVDTLINGYAGDLLETVCINFKPGADSCKNLPPVPKATSKTGRSTSLLSPLARIVTSLNG